MKSSENKRKQLDIEAPKLEHADLWLAPVTF